MSGQSDYFQKALSDFIHDAANGGAIRHLIDRGYSIEQIMRELDYPATKERVQETAYKYMTESGILLTALPVAEEDMHRTILKKADKKTIRTSLSEKIQKNGEKNSYIECQFDRLMKKDQEEKGRLLSNLTAREKEYLSGIPWKQTCMYHRLNGRMQEIGIQLALYTECRIKFYFLQEKEMMIIE